MADRKVAIDAVAAELDAAHVRVREIDQFAGRVDLTLAEAYDVQLRGIDSRQSRGERVVGLKLGLTSKAKARQMGVSDVILGVLTDRMQVVADGEVDYASLIHPRVEPEIAFRLAKNLPDALGDEGLLPYVSHVAVALEVIDSRYRNFRFSLEDVVADNTSGSHFVVGDWHEFTPEMRDGALADLDVELRFGSQTVASGTTRAILDDPLKALDAVRRLAHRHGHPLVPGSTILAGSATAAVELPGGVRVAAQVAGLGTVTIRTTNHAAVRPAPASSRIALTSEVPRITSHPTQPEAVLPRTDTRR